MMLTPAHLRWTKIELRLLCLSMRATAAIAERLWSFARELQFKICAGMNPLQTT
jgi:hypothetical protein